MWGSETPLGQQFGEQLFANQLVTLMNYGEGLVLEQIKPDIAQLMSALDGLVDRPNPLSPDELSSELHRLTTPLNDAMGRALPMVMARLQGPLQDQAAKVAPVTATPVALPPEPLMVRTFVGDESIAEHLQC